MKSLKDLIKKKMYQGDKMSDTSKKAMENVLEELEGISEHGMAKNLSKVTVASDSPEGLKEGLEMAEEKVEEMDKDSELDDLDAMKDEKYSKMGDEYDKMDYDEEAEDAKLDERADYMAETSDSDEYPMDEDEDYDSYSPEELEEKIEMLKKKQAQMKA